MTASRFALICYGDSGRKPTVEWTYWASRAEAEQALAELTPCSAACAGIHTIVGIDAQPAPSRHPALGGVS